MPSTTCMAAALLVAACLASPAARAQAGSGETPQQQGYQRPADRVDGQTAAGDSSTDAPTRPEGGNPDAGGSADRQQPSKPPPQ